MAVEFEAVYRPKFMTFLDDVGDPLQLSTHLSDCPLSCLVPKIQAVKIAVKLRSRPKKVVLGPDLQVEVIPQISDMHFQITLTSDVAEYGRVPFSELGDQLTKKRKKERKKERRKNPSKI